MNYNPELIETLPRGAVCEITMSESVGLDIKQILQCQLPSIKPV